MKLEKKIMFLFCISHYFKCQCIMFILCSEVEYNKYLTLSVQPSAIILDHNLNMKDTQCITVTIYPGLQKDRYRGTSGTKEGFSSIGRFSKN